MTKRRIRRLLATACAVADALACLPALPAVDWARRKPLTPPMRNRAFYDALLLVWLGEKPTSPARKARLLGTRPADVREARL